jgi:hypothetical protein
MSRVGGGLNVNNILGIPLISIITVIVIATLGLFSAKLTRHVN